MWYVSIHHQLLRKDVGQSSSDASQLPMIHMLVVNITFRNKNAFFFKITIIGIEQVASRISKAWQTTMI